MRWFYNFKTTTKLILAFIIMSLILTAVGLYGLTNMGQLNQNTNDMYEKRLVPIGDLSQVQILYQRLRINIRDIYMAETKSEADKYIEIVSGIRKETEALIDKYSKTSLVNEEKAALEKFASLWKTYNDSFDQAVMLNNDGRKDEFKALLTGDLRKQGDELKGILEQLILINQNLAAQASEDSQAMFFSTRIITITIIVISFILSISLGIFISQIIARPLNRVVGLVAKVANGDLRETIDIHTKDEIGQLAKSVNNMIVSLRQTVSAILSSAESVAAASQQISASTEEIASGSTSQANAAQTMNELFKELSVAINSVASSAEQASELSNRTMNVAQDGGKVVDTSIQGMNLVNEQMSRLEEDSNKIGEIIEVIDDIADQTNLLALNAAIEAARAGEQGRGFAVVADEVRKLAERSSEATKQITSIIKGMQENTQRSVRAVGDGVTSTQKTGEAFEQIISMVNESAQKVMEIAAASEEQAAQSSEVLGSIESISASTEEAAASSEETASTAQSLAQLADDLNTSVMVFKIK